jgi:hypothetical protein
MAAAAAHNPTSALVPPQVVDVSIVGAGPGALPPQLEACCDERLSHSAAGMMAALCLTTYGFTLAHFDERPEPTTAGRADGLQPRTLEVRLRPYPQPVALH